MSARTGRLQVALAAVLFSTGGVAVKGTVLTGWQVACFRSGLAALMLAALLPQWRRIWRPECLLVGVAYGATMVLFVVANKLTSAANTIFIQSTAPLWVMLLAPRLLGERLGRGDLGFAPIFGLGLVLFFAGTDPASGTAPAPATGNALAAVAGVCWAFALIGMRWLARDAEPERAGAAVVAGNTLACVACLPLAAPVAPAAAAADWLVVAYLGVFQIGLAYVLLTRGVRALPALDVSLLLLLEPVLGSFWAWWIHAERPGAVSLTACAVILSATLARTLWQSRPERAPA